MPDSAADRAERAPALWIVTEDHDGPPLLVSRLPSPGLLAAKRITVPWRGKQTAVAVVSSDWVLDEAGGWRVVLTVRPPGFSAWGWLDRRSPKAREFIAPVIASLALVLPAVLLVVLWRAPYHWLGVLVTNLDFLLGAAVGIAILVASNRVRHKTLGDVIGILWFGGAFAVGLGMWWMWPDFFAGGRPPEEIGAEVWELRGEIAASIGGWLVGALTVARLFGIDRPSALGAAGWLEKREGTARR